MDMVSRPTKSMTRLPLPAMSIMPRQERHSSAAASAMIAFLRDVGKHFTVNYMTAKDSVKIRMETGISYAEFGYMLIQGYDFLHLFETDGCAIQIGGSDQWGNMTTGLELIRRKHGKEAHALSAPLLTDSTGNKLGKSESGTIFLDPEMTS
ncbi:MAG: tyrosine--tRNA ligase, partial [Armatimonadetes bacterium]|nr:tyrosine--tRNA ligase [Armatimonadota bacterium]